MSADTRNPRTFRSRMGSVGSVLRRSSSFGFPRPSSPSRSSSEAGSVRSSVGSSLKVDSTNLATPGVNASHTIPSPVPESPAVDPSLASKASADKPAPEAAPTPPSPSVEATPRQTQPIDIPSPREQPAEEHPEPLTSEHPISETPAQMSQATSPTKTVEEQSPPGPEVHVQPATAEPTPMTSPIPPQSQVHAPSMSSRDTSMSSVARAAVNPPRAQPPPEPKAQPQGQPPAEGLHERPLEHNPWSSSAANSSGYFGQQDSSSANAPTNVDIPSTSDLGHEEFTSNQTTPRQSDERHPYPSVQQAMIGRKSSVSVGRKPRARGSTVSSQAGPAVPPGINGRDSANVSRSSLALSEDQDAKDDQGKRILIVEQRGRDPRPSRVMRVFGQDPFADPEDPVVVLPRSDSPVNMPEPSVINSPTHPPEQASATVMPKPKTEEPVFSRPFFNVADNAPHPPEQASATVMPKPKTEEPVFSRPFFNVADNAPSTDIPPPTIPPPTTMPVPDNAGYDTDESRPLLGRSSSTMVPDYGKDPQHEPAHPVTVYFQPGDSSIWPTPARNFEAFGWKEIMLPDSSFYYSHPDLHVTTDIDMRNYVKMEAVTAYLGGRDTDDQGVLPSEGWELWLKDAALSKDEFIPGRAWVNHAKRVISLEKPVVETSEVHVFDESRLDMEHRYWSYIEAHPAHAPLPPSAASEAINILQWSYADRLLPSSKLALPPFSQEECQELMSLLRSLEGPANQYDMQAAIRTRMIAKILLRITAWRLGSPTSSKDSSAGSSKPNGHIERRIPFRRTILDFVISIVCLGVPYLFVERSRYHRGDHESGPRPSSAGPMLVIGSCACLIAAVILSASVTLISLPGLDEFARLAGFMAIILSASSMCSSIVALLRYNSDIGRHHSSFVGEGMILVTRRSLLLSLPLVFLIWAIVAFITGITLYAFRGMDITNVGTVARHFESYTRWAVLGVIGGFVFITTVLLIRW